MFQNLSGIPYVKEDSTVESKQIGSILKAIDQLVGLVDNGNGAGSTELKQDAIINELLITNSSQLDILAELKKEIDIEEMLLEDSGASGVFYTRRLSVVQDSGSINVSYHNLDGTPYTPVGTGIPIKNTDYETTETLYQVTTPGVGYSIGDIVKQITILETPINTITGNVYYNLTTSSTINPNVSELSVWTPAGGLVPDLYNQVSIVYTTSGPSGSKEPLTISYRNNNELVATITLTHDSDGDIIDVVKS